MSQVWPANHAAVAQQPGRAADPGGAVLEPARRQSQQPGQLLAYLADQRCGVGPVATARAAALIPSR